MPDWYVIKRFGIVRSRSSGANHALGTVFGQSAVDPLESAGN